MFLNHRQEGGQRRSRCPGPELLGGPHLLVESPVAVSQSALCGRHSTGSLHTGVDARVLLRLEDHRPTPPTDQGRRALRKHHGTGVAAEGPGHKGQGATVLLHVRSEWGEQPGWAESSHRREADCGPSRISSRRLQLHYFSEVAASPKTQQQLVCGSSRRPPSRPPSPAQGPSPETTSSRQRRASSPAPAEPVPPREGGLHPPQLLLGPTVCRALSRGQGHCLTLGTDQTGRRACPGQPSTPKGRAAVCECV